MKDERIDALPVIEAELVQGTAQLQLVASAQVLDSGDNELPRFTLDAYSGGIMYPLLTGIAWEGPVVVEISGIAASGSIPVHRAHDRNRPVGHAEVRLGNRIRCEGVFSLVNADVAEILSGARNGFPWRASIGLQNMRYQIIDPSTVLKANGRSFDGPLLYVSSAELAEVSFVTIAGDSNTAPATIKDAHPMPLAAETGGSAGLSPTLGTEANVSLAAEAQRCAEIREVCGYYPALEATGLDEQAIENGWDVARTARVAQESQRIADIRDCCRKAGNPLYSGDGTRLEAHAIQEGWDLEQTEQFVAGSAIHGSPAVHSTSNAERCTLEALQAGIFLRSGRSVDQVLPANPQVPTWMSLSVNNPWRQQIMDNAWALRDLELLDYVAQGMQAMGQLPARHSGRSGRLATLQAAFSTGMLSNIFNQSIGAMAIAAYQETGDFSKGWTTEEPVPNLFETDRTRMVAAGDLDHHPTGGEAQHANRSDVNEKVRADRFSKAAEIDENDFINDRFQLLKDTTQDFGQAAARLRPSMVAAELLANDALSDGIALFHASHNNLLTGSALSQTTLRNARALLSKQVDGDANLNLQASHLLTPSDLGDLAIQLVASAIITNDSGVGGSNPIRMRNIMPVDEARLALGVVDPLTKAAIAGSATTWYLISNEAHTIEVQILEGTGGLPMVVVSKLTGGKFGLCITVKHFIGVKALDFRGMVKATA